MIPLVACVAWLAFGFGLGVFVSSHLLPFIATEVERRRVVRYLEASAREVRGADADTAYSLDLLARAIRRGVHAGEKLP